MNYRNIKELVKHIADKDPQLHESLSRINDSLNEIYKTINALDVTKPPRYSCALNRTANQSIPDVTFTAVQWDVTDNDNGSIHSNTVNNSRLTVPVPGLWILGYSLAWVNNVNGDRLARVTINGAGTTYFGSLPHSNTAGIEMVVNGTAMLDMRQNYYAEIEVFQNTGGALNLDGVNSRCWMALYREY